MDEIRRQFETNFFGLVRLTQLVLPHMRAAGRGRILNVSSMGGRTTLPGGAFYHASKHAVESLSDALRIEVRPFGIDVVLIEPGPVKTAWNDVARLIGRRPHRPQTRLRRPLSRVQERRRGRIRLGHRRPVGAAVVGRRRHRQGDGQGGDRATSPHPLPDQPGRQKHGRRQGPAARPYPRRPAAQAVRAQVLAALDATARCPHSRGDRALVVRLVRRAEDPQLSQHPCSRNRNATARTVIRAVLVHVDITMRLQHREPHVLHVRVSRRRAGSRSADAGPRRRTHPLRPDAVHDPVPRRRGLDLVRAGARAERRHHRSPSGRA